MSLRKSFRKWFSSRRTPIRNPRKNPNGGNKARPVVELLEDRTVPAVLFGNPAGQTVTDLGGDVIDSAQVDLIFWGSGWTAGEQASTQTAIDAILAGPYVDAAAQYRATITNGARINTYSITSTDPPANFTTTDVFNFLNANIQDINAAGPITESPTTTPDIYYFVLPQPGSTDPSQGLGGFHSFIGFGGNNYRYGWTINTGATAPDRLDNITEFFSHELIEGITDPEGDGIQVDPTNPTNWNEVADNTAQNFNYRVGGYRLQSYLSINDDAYIVPDGNTQNVFVDAAGLLTINGDQLVNKDDVIKISTNGAGHTLIDLNGETFDFDPGVITSIKVNGLTGTDGVVVDYSGGDPVPAGGIDYDGGGNPGDNLEVTGYTATTVTSTPTGTGAGTVQVDASALITYSNLTPLSLSGNAVNLIIDLTQTGVQNPDVVLEDDGGAGDPDATEDGGFSSISGSTFEYTEFANPTVSLQVILSDNGDTIDFNAMDASYVANTTIDGGTGQDTVNVNDTPAFTGTTINGGDDVDSINVTGTGGLSGTTVNGGNGADLIDIDASGISIFSSVQANGDADDDTFTVTGSLAGLNALNIDGGSPSLPTLPGDTLIVPTGSFVTLTGPGSGFVGTTPAGNDVVTSYTDIETVTSGGTFDLVIDTDNFAGQPDGAPDTVRLVRNGTQLEVYFNGVLQGSYDYASVNNISVDGSTDDDTLDVDNSGGLIERAIDFNGEGGLNNLVIEGDPGFVVARTTYLVGATEDAGTWVLDPTDAFGPGAPGATANPAQVITFSNLAPADDSTPAAIFDVVYDAGDADNITVQDGGLLAGFNSIRVVDNAGTFETFRFANKDLVRLHLNDQNDIAIIDYTVPATGSVVGTDMSTLEIYGHAEASIVGPGADDGSFDYFQLRATAAGVTTNLFGQDGDDIFENINIGSSSLALAVPGGTFSLDDINGPVSIDGGAHGANGDFVALSDVNTAAAVGDNAALTDVDLTGAAPATISYSTVEVFFYEMTKKDDTLDVTATAAGTEYVLTGDGGSDTFTVGNQTADFGVNPNGSLFSDGGSLDDINGPITFIPDTGNGPVGTNDILNIDDSGTASLDASPASISNIGPTTITLPDGETIDGDTTELLGFAPAFIRYKHLGTGGTFGLGVAGNSLEQLNVFTSTGADTIDVNATTASDTTRIDMHDGDDFTTMTIAGDALSANNIFHGSAGNDQFVLNINDSLGSTAVFPILSLEIWGDSNPAADTDNRDRLIINDNIVTTTARDLNWDYLDTAGDLDILANSAGNGLAGGNNATMPVNVRTMETVIFNSPDQDDTVRVTGTTGDDQITVAQLPDFAANATLVNGVDHNTSVAVFLGGTPYLNTPPVSLLDPVHLPGVAGGGTGPDLLINGMSPSTFFGGGGITLDGGGNASNAGQGDQAVVYSASEDDLIDGSGVTDVFGFGAGILQPGFGPGNAYDNIFVSDAGTFTTNSANGFSFASPLARVNLVTASFVQFGPAFAAQQPGFIVNGGDEPGVQPSGVADNFFVTPSANFNIQVNGNLPTNTVPGPDGSGVPRGDQLNISFPESINVFSDDASPPNVTINGQTNANPSPFGVKFSSIERINLNPGNGIVNIIGDNNQAGNPQNDYFKVIGGVDPLGIPVPAFPGDGNGVGQFSLQIGGSWDPATGAVGTPDVDQFSREGLSSKIYFYGVDRINAMGGPATSFDANGNAIQDPIQTHPFGINALDITAWANNLPTNDDPFTGISRVGWGIETYWNQGNDAAHLPSDGGLPNKAVDLLVVNAFGIPGISDGFVIQPSAPQAGQVSDTNLATGTSINVITYTNNTNIIVNGNSGVGGDTDTLTLRGTNPANPSTSGRETALADFTNAGIGGDELVRITDAANANILYYLQDAPNFNTINFELLGGDDTLAVVGRANGSMTVNADLGPPGASDTLQLDITTGIDAYIISPGASNDSGTVSQRLDGAAAPTIINFKNTEAIDIDIFNLHANSGDGSADFLTMNGTGADDVITLTAFFLDEGTTRVNAGPTVNFNEFGAANTFTANGLGGNDTFNFAQTDDWQFTNVNVNGSTGNGDKFNLLGSTASDDFTYTASSASDADLGMTPNAFTTTYHLSSVESANLDGNDPQQPTTPGDTLVITTPNALITPGANPGQANVAPVDANGNPLLPLNYTSIETTTVTGGTAVIDGTSADDTITIDATTGIVTVTNLFGFSNTIDLFDNVGGVGFTRVVINALGGDDNITVVSGPLFPNGIRIIGGEPGAGSDKVFMADNNPTIDFADANSETAVTGVAGGAVVLVGIETVTINGTDGVADVFTVNDYGFPTDVKTLNLNGGDTDNNDGDTIAVTTVASVGSTLNYTPLSDSAATLTRSEGGPQVNISGFNNADGNLTVTNGAPRASSVRVVGSQSADTIGVIQTGGGNTRVTVTPLGVVANKRVPIDIVQTGSGFIALHIEGGLNDDTLVVDNSNGLVSLPNDGSISYDGGTGLNALRLIGTTAVVSSLYIPGSGPGQGTVIHADAAGNIQQVVFTNLAPVFDAVAGPLTVAGTNADNAINYKVGFSSLATLLANAPNVAWGEVSVDGFEPYEFTNKTSLAIVALAGSDTINLNNPNTPTGLTRIDVDGGDPTASDTVIVSGTTGSDAVTIDSLTLDGARVTGLGPTINVTTAEHLTYSGQGGSDALTITTPAGGHAINFFPGANANEASIDISSFTAVSLISINYVDAGLFGNLTFDDAGGVRADILSFYGTNGDDRFTIPTSGQLLLEDATLNNLTKSVNTPGVTNLNVLGLDGDDTFDVAGNHPFNGVFGGAAIHIEGGNPSASDVLNFTSSGNPVTVDFGAETVTEGANGPVSYSGVETINVDGGDAGLIVVGTDVDDDVTITVYTEESGKIERVFGGQQLGQVAPHFLTPVVNYTNIGTVATGDNVSVNLGDGNDTLMVVGSALGQTFNINASASAFTFFPPFLVATPARTVDIDEGNNLSINARIQFTDTTESLAVFGLEGNDTFNVRPGPIPVFVDGGDPIGSTPGDTIRPFPASAFQVEPGPENDEGGVRSATEERISWDHIEAVVIVGGGPGKVLGTNGDDDITIIARDSVSTPQFAGSDGVQDFTVSVNDGPNILFLDQPTFFIDALAGDDDIVLRVPAPNGAVWDTDLFIAGGTPAAVTGDQGDVFEYETPNVANQQSQTINYEPNFAGGGLDTARITDSTNSSIITIAPFICPVTGNPSSPGGVEQIVYQGLQPFAAGTTDTLTMNGTTVDDFFVVDPNNNGAGSHRSSLAPTFDYTGATIVTVNGGTGGFDTVKILGTGGIDTVTSPVTDRTQFAVTRRVDVNNTIDRYELYTFGGADNITLDIDGPTEKYVNAGEGNDTINLSASLDATIVGGLGDDNIVGTGIGDLIYGDDSVASGGGNDTINAGGGDDSVYGGDGNDILIGAGGNDTVFGGAGNDIFGNPSAAPNAASDDPGDDFFFGEGGSDTFVWEPGDGNDVVEGGSGDSDRLLFFGSAGVENFNIFADTANPSRAHLFRSVGPINMDLADLEQIDLTPNGGADTVNVGRSDAGTGSTLSDLTTTTVQVVNVHLGADGAADSVTFEGRPLADNLLASISNGIIKVAGLSYDLRIDGAQTTPAVALANADTLTISGNEGDDAIKVNAGVEAAIQIVLNGNDGNDNLSADATINGGNGDDFIQGGAGADQLNGNAGEDTFVGGLGNDTIDGGADFDTILIRGTSGNDQISVNQTAAGTLQYNVNTVVETDTLALVAGVRTVEAARIEAGLGADIITVTWLDALRDATLNSLRMDVIGGPDFVADRLAVIDNGPGDLVLMRKGEFDSTGTVTIGPGNEGAGLESQLATYEGVEIVQPIAGTGGQIEVFKHDPYEFNDLFLVATHLGAAVTINVDPTIDPGAVQTQNPDNFLLPADEDYYRVEALYTGTLDFQVFFNQIASVPSVGGARPGLPGNGDLQLQLFDSDNTLIVTGAAGGFGTNDANNNERIRIPAVQGQLYYLRVFGATPQAINNYSMTIINLPAPTPFDLELDDVIVGAVSPVSVAAGATQTVFTANANAQFATTAGFYVGKYVSFLTGNDAGQRALITAYSGATRIFTLTPELKAAPTPGSTFQIESGDTGRSQLDNITRDNTPTIFLRLDDAFLIDDIQGNVVPPFSNNPPDEVISIPFRDQTLAPGFRIAIFDEGAVPPSIPGQNVPTQVQEPIGFATQAYDGFATLQRGLYTFTVPDVLALADGSHFLSARVQIIDPSQPTQTGFGARSVSLEIVVDTTPPPVQFGTVDAPGLVPDSDTGVPSPENTITLIDLATNDTTPSFQGLAEADSVVRLYVAITNPNNPNFAAVPAFPQNFVQIGQTQVQPYDGTNQFPHGWWRIDSGINMNDPTFFSVDGVRTLVVTAEDVAGNVSGPAPGTTNFPPGQTLDIFIDTRGPQITNVRIVDELTNTPVTGNDGVTDYDLFAVKPQDQLQGPTPLAFSIRIDVEDFPARFAPFLDLIAFKPEAVVGITVVGDQVGPIDVLAVIPNAPGGANPGDPARGNIQLIFAEPLPDDRYTLHIPDTSVVDPVGNRLDGESDASEPNGPNSAFPNQPTFPSGNHIPGGDFYARFTINSRPDIGQYGNALSTLDLNGNHLFDPVNAKDQTNKDAQFNFGLFTDAQFSGNFVAAGGLANGFGKLGAYGFTNGAYRFLLSTTDVANGVLSLVSAVQVNGLPVAFDFNKAISGDEIGLFDGHGNWYLDLGHSNNLSGATVISDGLRGHPIVGDFDGSGDFDLATYQPDNDTWQFDLNPLGAGHTIVSFGWGFPGISERPVANDMNKDGITDIGLFVPRTIDPAQSAGDWYFLGSPGPANALRPLVQAGLLPGPLSPFVGTINAIAHPFNPNPFSEDRLFTFGNGFLAPIVGLWDPPAPGSVVTQKTVMLPGTYGDVSVEAEVKSIRSSGSVGLLARQTANGQNAYWGGLVRKGATYYAEIRERTAGTWKTLTSQTLLSKGVTFTEGGTLRFEVVGTNLNLYYKGTLVASATDSTLRKEGGAGSTYTVGSGTYPAEATAVVRQAAPLPYGNSGTAMELEPYWDVWQGYYSVVSGALAGQLATNVATLYGVNQADTTVSATVDATTAAGFTGLLSRYNQTNGETYRAGVVKRNGVFKAEIWVYKGNTWKQIGTSSRVTATGTLTFRTVGTSQKLYLNGNLVASASDTSLRGAGTVGLWGGKNSKFDNLSFDAVVTVAPALPFVDDFGQTNTNNQLSAAWSEVQGLFSTAGGVLRSPNGTSIAVLNGISQPSVNLSVGVTSLPAGGTVALVSRYNAANGNMYRAGISQHDGAYWLEIFARVSGTWRKVGGKKMVGFQWQAGTLSLVHTGAMLNLTYSLGNGTAYNLTLNNIYVTAAGSVGVFATRNTVVDNFNANRI